MAHDESRQPGDEPSGADSSRDDAAMPIAIATSDPTIDSAVEHRADWKAHPETTLRVETAQVTEPALPVVSGVRTSVTEDDARRRDRRERDRDQHREADHDDRKDCPQRSFTKNLLITAGVALLCGVIGALGYSYVFGPKPDHSSQGKNHAATQKNEGSGGTSGGGESHNMTGQDSGSQPATSSSIPGFTSAEDADTLKAQIADLMQRIDHLGERVDRMTRPKDETPPVLRTMQIKMRELASGLDEVAALPAQVRHYENRLETLQEDIKTLRARIEAIHGGSTAGRITPGLPLAPGTAAASAPRSPTMDLGIGLLERGQYVNAREIFLRLQLTQPDDARVWYLSALAEGLTSGNWGAESKKLAQKGLECERAGSPSTAQIDAVLATRTPIKGQEWLASLRRRVLNPETSRD